LERSFFQWLWRLAAATRQTHRVPQIRASRSRCRAGALLSEYKQSKDATVKKYTGKTLIVKGYTAVAPIMPTGADDTGILTLGEKGGDQYLYLTCKFKQADQAGFAKITGDQTVSVTGVFDDSSSTALKNCQVVKVD
jgi:hypothetical protein